MGDNLQTIGKVRKFLKKALEISTESLIRQAFYLKGNNRGHVIQKLIDVD